MPSMSWSVKCRVWTMPPSGKNPSVRSGSWRYVERICITAKAGLMWGAEFVVWRQMITQAFILGAGLGTRLRPLTDVFPKPLVPLFHKPLAMWAVEACEAAGCARFAINTHHLPEKWVGFGAGRNMIFFHEPILLETRMAAC